MAATPAAPEPMSQSVAPSRKMRKGTHSCSECRRRKIRCKFQYGNASTCIPCAARGSRCLDQRHVAPLDHSTLNVESTSLQERVPVLESVVKNHVQIPQGPIRTLQALGLGDDPVEADERAPFVSMLNNTEGPMKSHSQQSQPVHDIATYNIQPLYTQSTSDVCSKLRSALPGFELLMSTLSRNGAWWSSFRHKTQTICQGPYESLATFAAHAYMSTIPAEVGMLVTAYARSAGQHYHLYRLVESLAIPESAQIYSAEVMELVLLLAKAYSDIGQPRQCWLMYRKGLAISEVMGLYRQGIYSLRLKSIWWAFYHGDRFSSLLLGLPYGFNDAHFGASIELDNGPTAPEQRFILWCAFIAGKVIDRNVMPGKPSSASSMLLDEQMDAIASSMRLSWWDLPDTLPSSDSEIDELRHRLLLQFYFFHVRINLHLPFIVRSESTPPQQSHRLACMEASRQLLQRFLLLRTRIRDASIFDCKTSDFVGFMAGVTLILGLLHPRSNATITPVSKEDQNLIALVKDIFDREEKAGCKIACQCRRMLDMLLGIPLCDNETSPNRLPGKIVIPYFGYIRRDLSRQYAFQALEGLAVADSNEQTDTYAPDISGDDVGVPGTESESNNLPKMMDTGMSWEFGGLEHFQVDDLSSWLDTAMLGMNPEWDASSGRFFFDDPLL